MNGIFNPHHGGNARNGKTTFPNVVARQERAKARQKDADARSPEEQLKRLDAAGLASPKERAKLLKRIADRNKPKPVIVVTTPQAEKKTKLTKEERRAKQFRPYGRHGPEQVTAEDAEKLRGIPVKLKPLIDVEIGK